jgi:tetratricopeptide (TPR) repeat protein
LKVVDEESVGLELASLLKTHLVAAFRGLGDMPSALAVADEAVSESDRRRYRFIQGQALFERGRTLRAVGRIDEANGDFSRAADLARETGAAALENRIQQALGA